jgi:predicted cobalt transporter CbtA
VSNFNAYTPLTWLYWILAVAAFVVEAWAFIDAIRRPSPAFPAAGKLTKPLWLIITGVATAIGLYGVSFGGGLGVINILPLAAFIAAAIYLTDVRPKVREMGSGGSSRQGPYGPW